MDYVIRHSSDEAKAAIGEQFADKFSRNVSEGACLLFKEKALDVLEDLAPDVHECSENKPAVDRLTDFSNTYGSKEHAPSLVKLGVIERISDTESIIFNHRLAGVSISFYLREENFRSHFREYASLSLDYLRFPKRVDGAIQDQRSLKGFQLIDQAWKDTFGTSENYFERIEQMSTIHRSMITYIHEVNNDQVSARSVQLENYFVEETRPYRKVIVCQMFKDL